MKAVILVRVSTDHQANSGLGVEAQRSACVAYAAKHGLEVIGEELELGVSGGLDLDQREGLLAAINTLGRGDVLLVAKRDRITRQMLVMAMVERMLEKRGARLASADGVANEDTPEAALMRSIITSFAVYERSLAKTRTKAALAAKRAQGKRYTRKPPFGFRFVDGLMVEHEDEQKALQMIHTLRSRGLTLSAISSELFAQGFTSRSGKAIGPGTLSKVLKRAA